MTTLQPFYEQVQSHYDLSDDFYKLFLDPSLTYSCAYFQRDDMSLEAAQRAKIDLSLGKLNLKAGQRLLDVGCGWGGAVRRAVEKYDVHAIGLTLSRNQQRHVESIIDDLPDGSAEVRLSGWEEFDEPVDRIVSIGAFEHFREERYAAFFDRCHAMLPEEGGRMLLHCICTLDRATLAKMKNLTREDVRFGRFIYKVIFPGGQLVPQGVVEDYARKGGFEVERTQSLQPHYARTLDIWAANLKANRDRAVAVTGQDVYDTYQHYLTGCADQFHRGLIDVVQFTLVRK